MNPKTLISIGQDQPICPYCNFPLDRMPGAKKKCPICSNYIYVRTRPSDRKKILIREDQIEEIQKLWAEKLIADQIEQAKDQDYFRVEAELRRKWNAQPSTKDIFWFSGMQKAIKQAELLDWSAYRSEKLKTAETLGALRDNFRAFLLYLEICYLDLNGPTNRGTFGFKLSAEFPIWDLQFAWLAPAVVSRLRVLSKELGYSLSEVETEFIRIATSYHQNTGLPVSPVSAWKSLRLALEKTE